MTAYSLRRVAVFSLPMLLRLAIQADAYRPDIREAQELSVKARGAIVHDVEPSSRNATRHGSSSVLQSAADPSNGDGDKHDIANAENSAEITTKTSTPNPEDQMKCAGKGNGWKCAADQAIGKAEGAPSNSGSTCKVLCDDSNNTQPKTSEMETKGVLCTNGKYDVEPECIQRIQCESGGGGWSCAEHKPGEKLNVGDNCTAVCAEPDWAPIQAGPSTCRDKGGKGELEPATGCKQLAKCPSKRPEQGWMCEGHMEGREEVASGQQCNVTCITADGMRNTVLVPMHNNYTCVDGKYQPELPACGTKAQVQAQEAKQEQQQEKSLASPRWSQMWTAVAFVSMLMALSR